METYSCLLPISIDRRNKLLKILVSNGINKLPCKRLNDSPIHCKEVVKQLVKEVTFLDVFDGVDGWIVLEKPVILHNPTTNNLCVVYPILLPVECLVNEKYSWVPLANLSNDKHYQELLQIINEVKINL